MMRISPIPQADTFMVCRCKSKKCDGLHIVLVDEEGQPMCEVLIDRENMPALVRVFEKFLGSARAAGLNS
jgi:hypothetical protein